MTKMLEDLDFANEITLLSHRHRDMQGKQTILQIQQKRLSLNINNAKTKVMKINAQSEEHITLGGTDIETVSDSVYRGSKITTDGDSMADVLARIFKATGAYADLRNIWRSAKIRINTKMRIFKSKVLGVLPYGAES